MQFPKYSKKVIYLEDRKQQKKDAKKLEKQIRIQQNYNNAHTLAQMLVAQPVCNKICEQIFPSWYRVRAKIIKRNWDAIREVSPFFADNKLDLWKRRCSCFELL